MAEDNTTPLSEADTKLRISEPRKDEPYDVNKRNTAIDTYAVNLGLNNPQDRVQKFNFNPDDALKNANPLMRKQEAPKTVVIDPNIAFEKKVQEQMKIEKALLKDRGFGISEFETRLAEREEQVRARLRDEERRQQRQEEMERQEKLNKKFETAVDKQMKTEEGLLQNSGLGAGEKEGRLGERRAQVEGRLKKTEQFAELNNTGVPEENKFKPPPWAETPPVPKKQEVPVTKTPQFVDDVTAQREWKEEQRRNQAAQIRAENHSIFSSVRESVGSFLGRFRREKPQPGEAPEEGSKVFDERFKENIQVEIDDPKVAFRSTPSNNLADRLKESNMPTVAELTRQPLKKKQESG